MEQHEKNVATTYAKYGYSDRRQYGWTFKSETKTAATMTTMIMVMTEDDNADTETK